MINSAKIIYFGSGNFGLKTLETLVKNGFLPDLIITTHSELEKFAKLNPRLKIDLFENLKSEKNSLFILASFGKILSKEILSIPKFGALNIHPSLLPLLRGPSPIQTAILEGKKETGLTIFLVDDKIDHGPILASEKIAISESNDYLALSDKLAEKGALLFLKILPDYLNGQIKPREQEHEKATFAKIFHKKDGQIDWNRPAETILRKIRALNVWPGAFTFWRSQNNEMKRLIILKAKLYSSEQLMPEYKPGEIIFENKKLLIKTKDNFLELEKVQPEAKKPMTGEAFYRGHQEIKNFTP